MLLTKGQSTYSFHPVKFQGEVSNAFVIKQSFVDGKLNQSYVGQITANNEVNKLLGEGFVIDFTSINY